MLAAGQLQLHTLWIDGAAVAVEHQFVGDGVVYAYQSGIEPQALKHSPGQLSNMIAIRRAVAQGCRAFDFLRGDEPYKARWRARPRATLEIRVAADRPAARLRHGIWLAGAGAKEWFKAFPCPAFNCPGH
jgi:CelD/BcsL family acetyltransferase involved in cellulose biosynthesis